MLDRTKIPIGDFDLNIGSGDFQLSGIEKGALSINEEVETEEIEDGTEVQLIRTTTIELTFSEIDNTDIAKIQDLGGGVSDNFVLTFSNGRTLTMNDTNSTDYIVYTAEISDGKTVLTAQKSSSDVNTSNITTT